MTRQRSRQGEVWFTVLLSACVWPGAGQARNGEPMKAAVLIIASAICVVAVILSIVTALWPLVILDPSSVAAIPERLLMSFQAAWLALRHAMAWVVGSLVIWLYAIVDAYRTARVRVSRAPRPNLK